jgi:hypothetical protein
MLVLSDEELRDLTRKVRADGQARVLKALGLTYGIRPDGSLVVLRVHLEEKLNPSSQPRKHLKVEPNWGAVK